MKTISADIGNVVNWSSIKTKYSTKPPVDVLHNLGKDFNA